MTQNSFDNAPQFDILLIPGSYSPTELPVSATSFLARQSAHPNHIALLSIASGITHIAQTGLLHKHRAAAPHVLLRSLQSEYPETFWQQSSWARHDKLWTSNSAVSALDMAATWVREYYWDRAEAVEWALRVAGVEALDEYAHCDY